MRRAVIDGAVFGIAIFMPFAVLAETFHHHYLSALIDLGIASIFAKIVTDRRKAREPK